MKLTRGTQVVYKPQHAKDINDPACEKGFVTSGPTSEDNYFCRFWLQRLDGALVWPHELRTKANSELCAARFLIEAEIVFDDEITEVLERYC